jgi:hypothetical protein
VLKIPDTASLLAETDVDRWTLKPQTRLRLTWAYLANARLLFSVHLERFARSIITLPDGSLRTDDLIARCLVAVHDAWLRDKVTWFHSIVKRFLVLLNNHVPIAWALEHLRAEVLFLLLCPKEDLWATSRLFLSLLLLSHDVEHVIERFLDAVLAYTDRHLSNDRTHMRFPSA